MPFHMINGQLYEDRDGQLYPVENLQLAQTRISAENGPPTRAFRPQAPTSESGGGAGLNGPDIVPAGGMFGGLRMAIKAAPKLSGAPLNRHPLGALADRELASVMPTFDNDIVAGGGTASWPEALHPPLQLSAMVDEPYRRIAGPTSRMRFTKMLAGAPRLGDASIGQGRSGAGANNIRETIGRISPAVVDPGAAYPLDPKYQWDPRPLRPKGMPTVRPKTKPAGKPAEGPLDTPFVGVTAEQIRQVMPNAGERADEFVEPINNAMAENGIISPSQQAAFLAHISVESRELGAVKENLYYTTPERLMAVWPRRFPTLKSTTPYLRNPEALANYVYAGRNGNGDAATGDGYTFRGGGLIQVTGRDNYRTVGLEDDPEALRTPAGAAMSAARYWRSRGLNEATSAGLNRNQFDGTTSTVNGGRTGADERWAAYQRALTAIAPKTER